MADITSELSTIATSIYGSEMRSAIHDAIEKVNNDTSPDLVTVSDTYEASGYTLDYLFEKTGDVVNFNFKITINTTFGSGKVYFMTVPESFQPSTDPGTKRVFPVTPCPFDDSGTNPSPYITMEKCSGTARVLYGDYAFFINNGDMLGWVSPIIAAGTYSVATPPVST